MRSIMARAVRVLRRKLLLQTQRTKGAQGVDGENLVCSRRQSRVVA
jgi:hypothetical protein